MSQKGDFWGARYVTLNANTGRLVSFRCMQSSSVRLSFVKFANISSTKY
jgi:hypothetical protein